MYVQYSTYCKQELHNNDPALNLKRTILLFTHINRVGNYCKTRNDPALILKQTLFFSSHLKFKFKKLEIHEVCPPPHELRTLFLFVFSSSGGILLSELGTVI